MVSWESARPPRPRDQTNPMVSCNDWQPPMLRDQTNPMVSWASARPPMLRDQTNPMVSWEGGAERGGVRDTLVSWQGRFILGLERIVGWLGSVSDPGCGRAGVRSGPQPPGFAPGSSRGLSKRRE